MNLSNKLKRIVARRIYRFIKYWAVNGGVEQNNHEYRNAGMKIGHNVAIYSSTLDVLYPELISIGDNVTITHATILTHDDSPIIWLKKRRVAPVTIGSNVFVGFQSFIMPGVEIGNNCIIAAGSIVTKNVPGNSIVAGNPARVIKSLTDYITKIQNEDTLVDCLLASNIVSKQEDAALKNHVRQLYRQDLLD